MSSASLTPSATATRVLVIGAGIAGASLGYHLARHAQVILLERESQPGAHATGRSAALFSEIYGGPLVRALSRASRAFLESPPPGFTDARLLAPRGSLFIATADQMEEFAALKSAPDVAAGTRELTGAEARALVPILREGHVTAALLEPGSMDIDVHALHQGFLRGLRQCGGQVVCNAEVTALRRDGAAWTVTTPAGEFTADVVVNAAGAWGDAVAAMAGVEPLGLTPCRRTAAMADLPDGVTAEAWPMVIDAAETFYFKPDAGRLLLSPADATPTAPCDAQPEDLDVAIAVDRVEAATTLELRRVGPAWAGLRTFVRDREPVAGFDSQAPGFFWLVGQGGYGIQTAPALGQVAAALVLGRPPAAGDAVLPDRMDAALSPSRLATATPRSH